MSVRRPDIHVHVLANTEPRKKEPVRIHFEPCAKRKAEKTDMRILHRTHRSVEFLETLEALYIREIGPTLNTKDEYRSRENLLFFDFYLSCFLLIFDTH